ncbi:MAG: class I SAM-dependent methyltransferase [Acidobacteria bacterium]|nr:class I SAM-dependent methyltransferase [Acidobacteriota bacterium]
MQPGNHSTSAPSPAIVFQMLNAHQQTEALRAAIELGIFAELGGGSATAEQLADRCSASLRGIRILCDFLTVCGLLQKTGGIYSNSPTAATFLDPKSPACLAATARFLGLPAFREPFLELAAVVRNGRTTMHGEGTVEPENPVWVEFAHSMAPMMAPLAAPLGAIVLEGRTTPMDVLDIAAGHGLFGIEIARQNPNAQVTALDWASVLEVAQANARKAGVAARLKLLPGSAFDVDFGGPYDEVLLTNFLHHFDVERNIAMLAKVRAALKPGGSAAILEFVPNEDRVSPPMSAAFALTMLASTAHGDAYTLREYTEMAQAAGFTFVTAHPVPMSPHTIVVAHTS